MPIHVWHQWGTSADAWLIPKPTAWVVVAPPLVPQCGVLAADPRPVFFPRSRSLVPFTAWITAGWSQLRGEVIDKECYKFIRFSSWQTGSRAHLATNYSAQPAVPACFKLQLWHHMDCSTFYNLLQAESAERSWSVADYCSSLCCSCHYHNTEEPHRQAQDPMGNHRSPLDTSSITLAYLQSFPFMQKKRSRMMW